ncbi:MAG: nuclear transport factor 2 family protein [Actinobacteria bacterium]|nr:nuclear transport factor 2 family protein [Actinomycetota bacterium]
MSELPKIEGLDQLRDLHVAALNDGDADAWAACFAADAVQMPPNMPANVGIDVIREWSRGFLGAFSAQFSLDPAEAVQAGPDWVIERGAYEIALTPNGGGGDPLRERGKYITVYQREGEEWKMARDIWNSDIPLPTQP